MENLLVVGVAVVAYVLFDLRRSRRQAPVRAAELLDRVERSVGVSVPLDVRDRLHAAVARRLRCPVFARSAGYTALLLSGVLFGAFDDGLGGRSSLLIGLLAAAGHRFASATAELVAHVVVGLSGFPGLDGLGGGSRGGPADRPRGDPSVPARPAGPRPGPGVRRADPGLLRRAAHPGLGVLAALGVGAWSVSWRTQPAVLQRRDVVT